MPWEVFKFERKSPDISLKEVISVRPGREIAVARDLVEKYIGNEKIEILMNFEEGEIGLRPGEVGYRLHCSHTRENSRASFVFDAKAFLKAHPIEPGRYPVNWDGEKLIVKVWEPKASVKPKVIISPTQPLAPELAPELTEEKSSSSEDGATCPVCQKGILKDGACSECGWDEAEGIECPNGLVRPLEDMGVCRGCGDFKRVYGDSPRRCKWEGWLKHE